MAKPKKTVNGTGDTRQMRCVKCKTGLAARVPDGKGGHVYQCPACGCKFKHATL